MESTCEERILSYRTCKKHMFMSVSGLHTMAVIGSRFIHNPETEITAENIIGLTAEIVAKFYLSLLNTIAQNVQKAAEAVRRAVDALRAALINMAKEMFEKIIKPVIDALHAYLINIGGKLKLIYNDYKAGRTPSSEHIKALINAILPPEVLNFITAMSIIYTVINIIVTFGVPGVGTIVSLAIGAAIGIAMTQYASPSLKFLNGLWDGTQEVLRNGLNSLFGVLKDMGMSVVDWTAAALNTVALAAGALIGILKNQMFEKKSIVGIVFGMLSIIAGFDQRDTWVGVAGVFMGFVSSIFGVWSLIDIVETTLDAILFVINLLAGMNGLGFSAIGLVV